MNKFLWIRVRLFRKLLCERKNEMKLYLLRSFYGLQKIHYLPKTIKNYQGNDERY